MTWRDRGARFIRTPGAIAGLVLLALMVGLAVVGPWLAPHSIDAPIGPPGMTPSREAPLGTDFLGRDVLSRVMHGGTSVLYLGVLATACSYLAGVLVGVSAAMGRTWIDGLLMRSVDVLLAFPGVLVLLLLVSGVGTSVYVLVIGVAVVQLPIIARLVRAATVEVTTKAYVEAAVARGERSVRIAWHDVLPNIAPVLLADVAVRFGYSVILIASMNYLSLGLSPPAADWGLMIAENRSFIDLNVWSVLAPALLLAALTISVSLIADAVARSMGRSSVSPPMSAATSTEPSS
jgi:ABC-type dipeptide/oligopeptide/nickel transport system permease subunit